MSHICTKLALPMRCEADAYETDVCETDACKTDACKTDVYSTANLRESPKSVH